MGQNKCKVCGFSENESVDTICAKCGEKLEIVITNEVFVNPFTNSQETTLRDKINFVHDKKKTRIIKDVSKIKESSIAEKNLALPSFPTQSIEKNVEEQDALKRTMYKEDFLSSKDDKLKFQLIPLGEGENLPIKGYQEEVTLSRNDIDNEDFSISGNNHVKISQVEDKWVLENVSSNGAVFIRVENKMEIKENDIIIIGKNKTFLFKPK